MTTALINQKSMNRLRQQLADIQLGRLEQPDDYGLAIEVNKNPAVPFMTVSQVQFMGYNKDGTPCFVFDCPIGRPQDITLPIHDHRDNYNGGFSFSVYHPGTALPQQPWSM